MTDLVDGGMSLSSMVEDDDNLYRIAQGLIALTHAPGQRNLLLRRHNARWAVLGRRGAVIEFPPPALGLDAGLKHQAHLYAIFLAPLAVEVAATVPGNGQTYHVQRPVDPVLDQCTRLLATALDAVEGARGGVWWSRRRRGEEADTDARRAQLNLRRAAERVTVIRQQVNWH